MTGTAVVAIGDSLTYGYPYPPDYSWVRIAADHFGVAIVNQGVCGETTGDMRRRFAVDVIRLKPTHAIITGGSNDAFMGVATTTVAANMAAMIDEARAHGIRAVVGLPPPCDYPEESALAEYRVALRRIAATGGLPVIDFHAALADAGGGLRPGLHTDGVHPNEDGYAVMAAAAIAVLAGVFAAGRE